MNTSTNCKRKKLLSLKQSKPSISKHPPTFMSQSGSTKKISWASKFTSWHSTTTNWGPSTSRFLPKMSNWKSPTAICSSIVMMYSEGVRRWRLISEGKYSLLKVTSRSTRKGRICTPTRFPDFLRWLHIKLPIRAIQLQVMMRLLRWRLRTIIWRDRLSWKNNFIQVYLRNLNKKSMITMAFQRSSLNSNKNCQNWLTKMANSKPS